ncbi:unnamed protein product [Boreogadus saida]
MEPPISKASSEAFRNVRHQNQPYTIMGADTGVPWLAVFEGVPEGPRRTQGQSLRTGRPPAALLAVTGLEVRFDSSVLSIERKAGLRRVAEQEERVKCSCSIGRLTVLQLTDQRATDHGTLKHRDSNLPLTDPAAV